ncbi:hypothetical protein [Rubritalea marina]|uniref:hypothetical protein n=1 Tax=Rubritalea marina TaxID=361055 RepID=UPI000378AAFF|nr:hypothetical protein [Rubritalea marina]
MNVLLASICASLTGISLGVGIKHHLEIEQLIQKAEEGTLPVVAVLQEADGTDTLAFTPDSKNAQDAPSFVKPSSPDSNDTVAQQLNQLKQQQSMMLRQQSELNREVNAIQFRLDTHSASFRPLRTEPRTPSQDNGELPFDFSNNPLLPPIDQ